VSASEIERLLEVMRRLRDPRGGCPWDIEQDFASIAPYTIEEAYEVADAIARGDRDDLRDELGDLLLQVVYHARMAEEAGSFDFADVARGIADKMVRRHPHVFGNAVVEDAPAQRRAWEDQKAAERNARRRPAARAGPSSLLDDVPLALPALTRALKLQKRATRGGFDWPETARVLDKIEEEIGELRRELEAEGPGTRIADELGDLLFTVANLCRHQGIDPEEALRGTNRKFERRFRHVEATLAAAGERMVEQSLDQLETLWQRSKKTMG
jgi:MazG family protein